MALDNIASICSLLHEEAINRNFYNGSEVEINNSATDFVVDVCNSNGLTAHSISPMRWSFESPEHGMYENGVIELRNIGEEDTQFKVVDLSNVKLTDEQNIME